MFTPNLGFVLLFVSNPQKSGLYYQDLFGIKPIEESSTFVMKKWGFPFRRGSFEILYHDFELIAKNIKVLNE